MSNRAKGGHSQALSNPTLLSPARKNDSRIRKKKDVKQKNQQTAPPHLIFEQGEILKCFPEIDIKQLILQILNQKVVDVFPYTKSMQNDIIAISTYSTRDWDKFNRVKYYNFIINDQADQDARKDHTVYQHLKQKNFSGDESLQKRLLIKVVDRLDSKHKILNKQTGLANSSRFNYEQIQFEPVLASTVVSEEQQSLIPVPDALIGVYVYGRIDMLHCNFNMSNVRLKEPPTQGIKFPIKYLDTHHPGNRSLRMIQGGLASHRDDYQGGHRRMASFPERVGNFLDGFDSQGNMGGGQPAPYPHDTTFSSHHSNPELVMNAPPSDQDGAPNSAAQTYLPAGGDILPQANQVVSGSQYYSDTGMPYEPGSAQFDMQRRKDIIKARGLHKKAQQVNQYRMSSVGGPHLPNQMDF